jgi:hypothetical protein
VSTKAIQKGQSKKIGSAGHKKIYSMHKGGSKNNYTASCVQMHDDNTNSKDRDTQSYGKISEAIRNGYPMNKTKGCAKYNTVSFFDSQHLDAVEE